MSRKELALSAEKIQPFDLEALKEKAAELNHKNQENYSTPFPNLDYS